MLLHQRDSREPARNGTRLRDVLFMAAAAEALRRRPVSEYEVYCVGVQEDRWGGITLFGHLKKLVELGWLERVGERGGYRYSVTAEGRARMERP